MKTCPECHGEGEVKDDVERAAVRKTERTAAAALLAKRFGIVFATLAIWPFVVTLFYGAARLVMFLCEIPLTVHNYRGEPEAPHVLEFFMTCGVVSAFLASVWFVILVGRKNWND